MKKQMSKCLKINLIVWSVVLVIVTTTALIYYCGARYPEFKTLATQAFEIPGLETRFVPQGLEYEASSNKFLVSGYMDSDDPSRIYVIDKASGNAEKYVTLRTDDGLMKGHFGGITVSGDDCFVASDKMVYRFSFEALLTTKNGESVSVIDSFESGNGADFILTYQDMLIVGEFYHQKKYPTRAEHHITTASGETNHAVAYVYLLNSSKQYGVESITPEVGISLPDFAQGMSFTQNGEIVVSTSYSIPSSKILTYKNVLNDVPTTKVTIDGNTLQVYELNSTVLTKTIKAPAMSEELVLADGKVYLLFESACKKWKLINRTRTKYVLALNI